jgi:hypothetical protein
VCTVRRWGKRETPVPVAVDMLLRAELARKEGQMDIPANVASACTSEFP